VEGTAVNASRTKDQADMEISGSKRGDAMPSLIITVNRSAEIRVNLPRSSTRGVHINLVGSENETEGPLILFHVGGVDGKESISWITPDIHIGDEINIKISNEPVIDSETQRSPYERMDRGNPGGQFI
jgi:hypothetical protein